MYSNPICVYLSGVELQYSKTHVCVHGPLARYGKLRIAHAPGMPGTFIQPLPVSDPDMHHRTCVMHVPWCMPESLTSVFIWRWWQGKCSRHCQRMRNPQFYVSGMRSIGSLKHPEIASPTVPNWSQICLEISKNCQDWSFVLIPECLTDMLYATQINYKNNQKLKIL